MGFIGFLILLASVGLLVSDKIVEKIPIGGQNIDLIKDNRRWIFYITCILGIIMMFNPFVYNSDGERTYVQDPIFKVEKVIFQPGYTWGGFLHKQTEWPDVMTTDLNKVPIRFNDATQATASATVRWQLPNNEEDMMRLHKAYRTPEKLQSRTLTPYSQECLGFSSQLMESETHYSGGQSKLKEDFRTQLLKGQYVLETNVSFKFDSLTSQEIKINSVDLRRDVETGKVITIPSDVQEYGIIAKFAAVPHVDYEPIIDEKLQKKIEQSTKESIAKQSLITAEQEALTAKAKGKELLATTKAREEAAKLESVIRAQMAKDVAEEESMQAKFIAEKTIHEGRADAEIARLKVSAGLSPKEQAEFDMKTAIGVAAALAGPNGIVFPKIVSGGSGGSNSSSGALQTVELKMLHDLAKDMSSGK